MPRTTPPDTLAWSQGSSPLVFDSPHSGTQYPADFGYACSLAALRLVEDTHVERLYRFVPELGASWLEALFPRSYLDVNRALTDMDPALLAEPWPDPVVASSKVRLGKGLIWRTLDDGTPIYRGPISVADARQRIAQCWRPYHERLEQLLDAAFQRHGWVLHINCHSMPAVAGPFSTEFPGEAHADFVLGDRDHTTASAKLTTHIASFLGRQGYSVMVNHPYKGVELVRRYSNPAQGRHSIQLEINKRLYMEEGTLALTAGFERTQATLRQLFQGLSAEAAQRRW